MFARTDEFPAVTVAFDDFVALLDVELEVEVLFETGREVEFDDVVVFVTTVVLVLVEVVFDPAVLFEVVFPLEEVELEVEVLLDDDVAVPFEVALEVVLEVVFDVVLVLVPLVVELEVEFELVELDVVELVVLVLLVCIIRALSWVSLVTFFIGASSKSAIVATDSKAPLKEAVLKALEVARTISTNTKEVTFIDYYFHNIKLKYCFAY